MTKTIRYRRVQFTAWNREHNFDIAFNKDYLDFEYDCSYGFQKQTSDDFDKGFTYDWITRKDYYDRKTNNDQPDD